MSHFQNSVCFESGFAVSRASMVNAGSAAKSAHYQGSSIKMRLHFDRASDESYLGFPILFSRFTLN
jgi:hypothetical protein